MIVAQTASPHTPKWAHAFAARGAEVLVVSESQVPLAAHPGADSGEGNPVQVEFFPQPGAWWSRLPVERLGGGWPRWIAGYPTWRRLVHAFRPDIVHMHFVTADARNHFYFEPRLVERLVVSAWGSDVVFDERPSERDAGRLGTVLARADRLTATTHFLAEETRLLLPETEKEKPIEIIGFGVDTEMFRPADEPVVRIGGALRLGWAKGLETLYGTRELVAVFNRLHLRFPELELVIAGSGSQERTLRAGFAEGGSERCVRFLGRIPPPRVAEMLRDIDIFLMPSICRESFGVAALEAGASGVPVVGSDCGGIPEAVVDGETGLLVPPGDVAQLEAAIVALIESPEKRAAFGAAGRAFVESRFPWERSVAEMDALYASLL